MGRETSKTALILAAIVLAALGMRALSYRAAFRQGRVYFFGSDSWHHMRRIHYGASHRLRMPEPDPLLNFPEGSYSQWGWPFDLTAQLAVLASGAADKAGRERVAAWVPAVLGALCVIPAFFLGAIFLAPRREAGRGKQAASRGPPAADSEFDVLAGLLTALFVALLPGHGEYTLLGNLDHHVMESLLFAASVASLAWMRRAPREGLWAFVSGILLTLIYSQHPVLGTLYGGVYWVACLIEERLSGRSRQWWIAFALAGAAMLPPAFWSLGLDLEGARVSGQVPRALVALQYSFFQPAGLFFFSLTLWLAGRLRRPSEGGEPAMPLVSARHAAAAAGALICAAAMAVPFLGLSSILVGGHRLYNLTAENSPILFLTAGEGFKPGFAHSMFGWMFLAFPIWWVWEALKKERDYLQLSITAAVFVLVMFQVRFVYLFSYAFALAAASTCLMIWRRREEWGRPAWAALALIGLSFAPCAKWWTALAQASPYKYLSVSDEFYEAALWLHDHAPNVEGFDDASGRPAWSVLAQWDQGHALSYIGEQAVVADPFNHGMEISARYYAAADPREAVGILDEKKVRYVLARDMSLEGWQGVYSTFLDLSPDHPLRRGEWWRLFQMRLLMNLPVAGPDGHPFKWGHRLAFLSSQGHEAVFEYDASQVRGFKRRRWGGPSGAAARVGNRTVRRSDVAARARLDDCFTGRSEPFAAFMGLFKTAVLEELMAAEGRGLSSDEVREEAARVWGQLGDLKSCIERLPNGREALKDLVARPRLLERRLQETAAAAGLGDPELLFRLLEPKLRYQVYESAWEAAVMESRAGFLTALEHGG